MTESSPVSSISTFVVRFWREWSVAGPRWRGQIDHVQSGQSASFLDLEEMLGIIQIFGIMVREARQTDDINTYEEPVQQTGCPSDAEAKVGTDENRDRHNENALE